MPFDRFMALALYAPGLGYYARDDRAVRPDAVIGQRLRHRAGAVAAVRPGAGATGRPGAARPARRTRCGSSAPARARSRRSCSTPLASGSPATPSSTCRAPCADASESAWRPMAGKVRWADALPRGDAGRDRRQRGARRDAGAAAALRRRAAAWCDARPASRRRGLAWSDRLDRTAAARARARCAGHDHLTEIHRRPKAFIATLADRLQRGAAFFIDYGFPEAEYYHPQRQAAR